ncbi:MAG: hypothetical protein Q8N98_01605 [bacterium]|nr:hypothetical protein [bacterium]
MATPKTPHSLTPNYRLSANSVSRRAFLAIGLLIILALFLGAFLSLNKNKGVAKIPNPSLAVPQTPGPISEWTIYKNKLLGFELKIPNGWEIKEEINDFVTIGDKIAVYGNSTNPEDCKVDCSVIDEKETRTINGINMRYLRGQRGAVGGNTPQSYVDYVIPRPEEGKYIIIQLQELSLSAPLDLGRQKIEEIAESELKIFDQILSTFKFLD